MAASDGRSVFAGPTPDPDTFAAAGNGAGATLVAPAVPPGQWVAAEVFADVDGELADRQRVAGAAGDRDRAQPLLGGVGGGGDAGVRDVIDGNYVDPVRGVAGQVGEAARRVGGGSRPTTS